MDEQRTRPRFGLSSPETGKPIVVPYNNRDDYSIWRSAMNIAHGRSKSSGDILKLEAVCNQQPKS